jgi:hypothetical protein
VIHVQTEDGHDVVQEKEILTTIRGFPRMNRFMSAESQQKRPGEPAKASLAPGESGISPGDAAPARYPRE